MQNEMIENFQKMMQMSLENFKKMGETNWRISEKLMQEQVGLTNALLESASGCMSCASEVKDMKDVAAKQAEWAQEWSQKVMESTRTCGEIMSEAGKFYTHMFETGMKNAGCTEEKAAKAARKAA